MHAMTFQVNCDMSHSISSNNLIIWTISLSIQMVLTHGCRLIQNVCVDMIDQYTTMEFNRIPWTLMNLVHTNSSERQGKTKFMLGNRFYSIFLPTSCNKYYTLSASRLPRELPHCSEHLLSICKNTISITHIYMEHLNQIVKGINTKSTS